MTSFGAPIASDVFVVQKAFFSSLILLSHGDLKNPAAVFFKHTNGAIDFHFTCTIRKKKKKTFPVQFLRKIFMYGKKHMK
ncbi:Uncharacterized protein APZ42_024571 [Daphnia magna]|uniref:Uncharacterized protein n=1 Tax=Daphnia magna TaxID=35525 RepID=A0A164TZF8_9CRUS|nr:Uncharacterized protein APZ42_024571 [Daphnia magna]